MRLASKSTLRMLEAGRLSRSRRALAPGRLWIPCKVFGAIATRMIKHTPTTRFYHSWGKWLHKLRHMCVLALLLATLLCITVNISLLNYLTDCTVCEAIQVDYCYSTDTIYPAPPSPHRILARVIFQSWVQRRDDFPGGF